MSIQLICINYGNFEDAKRSVKHCMKIFPRFEKAVLLHPDTVTGIEHEGISYKQAWSKTQNECFLYELPQYITCDHAIGIQWDGFIIRPDLWNPDWLQYDWIAPPWPLQNIPNPEHRVGSGGFCMFSKAMSRLWPHICDSETYNDWQIGATKRELFEKAGMKYAPVEVAAKFGKEHDIEEEINQTEGNTFGFHDFRIRPEERESYRKLLYGK